MTRDEILSMEAGPEMDALVAERVMGWTWGPGPCLYAPRGPGRAHPKSGYNRPDPYSTDIAAAWEVLGRLRDKRGNVTIEWRMCEAPWHCPCHEVTVSSAAGAATAKSGGEMPLAICRAALLATLEAGA